MKQGKDPFILIVFVALAPGIYLYTTYRGG